MTLRKITPPAYPYGWFAVGFVDDLSPNKVATRRFMDRDIVLAKTHSGIHAAEAHCPHLGAHLGHGGQIIDGQLSCPFHGLRFSPLDGRCVYSPYGHPPPAARLGILPTREISGAVLVWHGPGQPFLIPPFEQGPGWHPLHHRAVTFATHPQEVTENSVDLAHLSGLHGFNNVRITEPITTEGPCLQGGYAFTHQVLTRTVQARYALTVYGLGFSLVDIKVLGFWVRQLILSTQIGPRETIVRIATTVAHRGRTWPAKMWWTAVQAVFSRALLRGITGAVKKDGVIWDHKTYLERPAIAEGDGPIALYRRWAAQFYPSTGIRHRPA